MMTTERMENREKDLSEFANHHGKRWFTQEVQPDWKNLHLNHTSVVWAEYQDNPPWPAKVVGFVRNMIKVRFFPTDEYHSNYLISSKSKVHELRDKSVSECRIIAREGLQEDGYTMEDFEAAIAVMLNFVDVEVKIE